MVSGVQIISWFKYTDVSTKNNRFISRTKDIIIHNELLQPFESKLTFTSFNDSDLPYFPPIPVEPFYGKIEHFLTYWSLLDENPF